MSKTHVACLSMIFALMVCGCSIEVSPPQVATPTSPVNVSTPTTVPGANPTSSLPANQVPWASLNLTGRLVYISAQVENNAYVLRIRTLDLVTGIITTIYEAPPNSWIYYVSVSPDDLQLIMSYSPPHAEQPDVIQALYTLPLDGSQPPQLLIMPPTPEDQFNQAEWSPDGKYIYYTHVNYRIPKDPNRIYPLFEIFRMAYPGGQPEEIAEKAYWPRLSPDSARLVYVSVDPFSFVNKLVIADANGENAHEVVVVDSWNPNIKDAPIFAPDGPSIIFSAAANVQSNGSNWLDQLMGIKAARADGTIPSEWWSVPINGGKLTQLTQIRSIGLFASISPDNKYIASASGDGILVMKADGSELTLLLPDETNSGTVSWIP